MKRIAVLHSQVPFVRGGAELHVEQLVFNLKRRGYKTELLQLPFKWYPEEALNTSMLQWRLINFKTFDAGDVDGVIATKFPSYGAKHPNKVTWMTHQFRQVYDLYDHEHGGNFWENGEAIKKNVTRFDNLCLPESKGLYTISQNVTDRLYKYNGIKSEVLYHPPALSGKYYTDSYEPYILSVGRLDPLKRIDLLIHAAKQIPQNIKIMIAGTGPQKKILEELVESLDLADRVKFLGFVNDDELLRLYANAGVVYFSPVDEDYGYITLEAFLSKKLVITCHDSGGVLEFVKHKENGYVCEPSPESIATAITHAFKSKSRLTEKGEEGYNLVKDISWDNVIDRLTFEI